MDTENDIFLHVSSKDSIGYFPDNTPALFRVKLNNTLNLKGMWQIGLCQLTLENVTLNVGKRSMSNRLFIGCNVCSGMIVDGKQTRVIRTVTIPGGLNESYGVIFYMPIQVRFIDCIEFRILNDAMTEVSCTSENNLGYTSMTLHIKHV